MLQRTAGKIEVAGDRAVVADLIPKVEATLAPTDPRKIREWIAQLAAIAPAPRRIDGDMGLQMFVEAYRVRLEAYPIDVVRRALLVETWPFFPSWHELKEVCEKLVSPRRLILLALRRALEERDEEEREPPASPEARARILAEIAKKYETDQGDQNDEPS